MKIAIYPGSFDPVTLGHADIIRRAAGLFDKVIVAVGVNVAKKPLFTFEERAALIREACGDVVNLSVIEHDGLIAEAAEKYGAVAIVRGIRSESDFAFEQQMAVMNKMLNSECETVFMAAAPEFAFISSSAVREIAHFGGDISGLVPECVRKALNKK